MSPFVLSSLLVLSASMPADGAADPAQVRAAVADAAPFRRLRLADPVPQPALEAYSRAAGGEIVTGLVPGLPGEPHGAWAVAVLAAPVDQLWAAVNDELGFAEQAWGGRGVVIRGEACADGRASLVTMPVPIFPDRWWVVGYRWADELQRASSGALRELSWREAPGPFPTLEPGLARTVEDGAQVRISRGAWLLIALDEDHTIVEYQLQSDAGGGLPGAVAAPFCSAAIRDTLRSMEARAQRGSRCPVATTSQLEEQR
jgi:hypothetical protein